MIDRLKSYWKIFGQKIYLVFLDVLLCVGMPLLKYIGYIVIVVTSPLWLPIYWFVKGKEIKERENNADRTLPKSGFINLLCGAFIYTETLEQYNKFRRTFKAEAIKEFAEIVVRDYPEMEFYLHNLVKEMVGE